MSRGGPYIEITVGTLGASGANVAYTLRPQALVGGLERQQRTAEKLHDRLLLRHIPDYVTKDAVGLRELRQALSTWAWAQEQSEIRRFSLSSGHTGLKFTPCPPELTRVVERKSRCRSHYRIKISWPTGVDPGDRQILRMVDEYLETCFRDAPAVAAIHRNTGNVHVHVWIGARQNGGLKLNRTPAEWRRLDQPWNEIYCRVHGGDPQEHLAKKEQTRVYKGLVSAAVRHAAAEGRQVSWEEARQELGERPPDRYNEYRHLPVDPIVREVLRLTTHLRSRSAALRACRNSAAEKDKNAAEAKVRVLDAAIPHPVACARLAILTHHLRGDEDLWAQLQRLAGPGDLVGIARLYELFQRDAEVVLRAANSAPALQSPLAAAERVQLSAEAERVVQLILQLAERPALQAEASRRFAAWEKVHAPWKYEYPANCGTRLMRQVYVQEFAAWSAFAATAARHGAAEARRIVTENPSVLGDLRPYPSPMVRGTSMLARVVRQALPSTYTVADRLGREQAAEYARLWEAEQEQQRRYQAWQDLNRWLTDLPQPQRIRVAVQGLSPDDQQQLRRYLAAQHRWPELVQVGGELAVDPAPGRRRVLEPTKPGRVGLEW